MKVNNIIKSLEKYYGRNKYEFYKEAINKLKIYEKKNKVITLIPEDSHILEAIKIHLSMNSDKYKIYITNNDYDRMTHRKLSLTDNQLKNLSKQLHTIYTDKSGDGNNLESLCERGMDFTNDIKFVYSKNKKKDEVMFKNKDEVMFEKKDVYDLACLTLGVENLRFWEHQNLDNFCKILNSKHPKAQNMNKLLKNYIKSLKKLPWEERERIMIFSGVFFHSIGLTYTDDVDTMIVKNDVSDKDKYVKYLENNFKDIRNLFDYHILFDDGNWLKNEGEILAYQREWFTYKLPNYAGAKDIYDVLANPKHHCYFMGMKLTSIDINMVRSHMRGGLASIVDLVMISKINNIILKQKPCIPNMKLNQGQITVYAGKNLNNMYNILKSMLKSWYSYNISMEELKERVRLCTEDPSSIYAGKIPIDNDTQAIKDFHTDIKRYYILKYCKGCDSFLDVGAGRLRDLDFWNEAGIKNVVAIEPSQDSIKLGIRRIRTRRPKTKIMIIKGVGDEDWNRNNYYNVKKYSPYDCVVFQFTIHYMFKKMDVLMKNLSMVTKKGTNIIINCVDGDYAYEQLVKGQGRTEVRNEQEPIFGIYSLHDFKDKTNQVLVYFKGTYGVQYGSIEYLVFKNYLLRKFDGYTLVEEKGFLDIDLKLKNKMTDLQKEVSRYYKCYIFKKN